ncbi:hypothetical protein V5O48_015189 [Marasmius crinis-equi]|uniref:Nephrocystin 3-like N-terminal domain-containing protein n=1 Tax=Marasmius crinis-equi TaxID=585013 RepID=A0ABR3EV85_9AGAR
MTILWDLIKDVGASHKAEHQVSRGECLEGTREEVLQIIHGWRVPGACVPPICWLSGAAGVGKSSIAMSVAKSCEDDGLISSFFCFRSDPQRNNPNAMVPTIAHGLAVTNPSVRQILNKRITADPSILRARFEVQFEALVKQPITTVQPSPEAPNLIIIDGLDECSDELTQLRILNTIASAYRRSPESPHIPLRFLVCSRPEVWIRRMFEGPRLVGLAKHIVLDERFDPTQDIRRFYEHEFREIRESMEYQDVPLPNPWPSESNFNSLVQKSDGQFSYAATAVRIVKHPYISPVDQLNIILAHHTTSNPSPFAELDHLYHVVLSANPDYNKVLPILSAILIVPTYLEDDRDDRDFWDDWDDWNNPPGLTPEFIELLLGLSPGEVALRLRGMHSVLSIRGRKDGIYVYHTSFTDYLCDRARSGDFYIDKHAQEHFLFYQWLQALSFQRFKEYR